MKDVLLALLGCWLGGLAIPLIKILLEDIPPFHMIAVSNTGAVLILLLVKAIRSPGFKKPKKDEWKWLAGGLICGPGLAVPLAIVGMVTVSGSLSGILFNLETFFTFFMAFLLFREKLSGFAWAAMLFVFIGGIIGALGAPIEVEWLGMLMIIGACFFFSFQTNLFKKLESQDGYSLAIYDFFAAGVVSLFFIVFQSVPVPPMKALIAAFFTGVLTYAFANVIYFRSVKKIGAGRTATIFGAAPLLGALSSFIILGDPLTPIVGLSLILVGIGLGFLVWEERKSRT